MNGTLPRQSLPGGVLFIVKPVCALILLILWSDAAWADAGLDLAVLIDSSASMSRDRRLTPLLLRMTLDLMARNGGLNHLDHRLATVSFGSAVRVDIPFTRIRPEGLRDLRRRIDTLPYDGGGETDVLAAFVAVEKLFRDLPADSARRRAVVLLTDGVPYVRGSDKTAYRAELQRFVATRFAARQVTIDVLLLGPGAETSDRVLWRKLGRVAENAGRAPDELLAQAHRVITGLAGTRAIASAPAKTGEAVETLVVPPYLDVVVFDVFRASPDAGVEVYAPGRTVPVRAGVEGVESVSLGQVLATLVIPRPPPGQWIIRKSRPDARVRILSQQFFPRGLLIRPAATDELRQYDRIAPAYRIVDAGTQPLAELRGYALAVELTLVQPNGRTTLMTMERDAALGPSAFLSARDAECELPGRYWTDVRITAVDARGHRLEVFRDRWSGFSVAPAGRVDCRVTTSGTAAWLPMRARVDCAEPGRGPIDMSAIMDGIPAGLFRPILLHEGHPVEATLDLRYLGGGAFRGWLRGARRGGAYELQLAVDRSRLRVPYNIRFLPPRVSFTRRLAAEWIVIPLLALAVTAAAMLRRRKTKS